ncbi:hypothetical protein BDQ17DRAFT_1333510 [Cyathus striatus]|nr:hypothetical protein BDQ17DRAFT_1333510 [Cyathus striatus]
MSHYHLLCANLPPVSLSVPSVPFISNDLGLLPPPPPTFNFDSSTITVYAIAITITFLATVNLTHGKSAHDFSTIEGVQLGSKLHAIKQRLPLPDIITNKGSRSKRFNQGIKDIIQKSEHLSHQTSGWLMVLGRHTGEGSALHFTSHTLRKMPLGDRVTVELAASFHNLTNRLKEFKEEEMQGLRSILKTQMAKNDLLTKILVENGHSVPLT